MGKFIFWVVVLSGLLMVLVYFKGFQADTTAASGAINSLLLTITGRNKDGQFANYPT